MQPLHKILNHNFDKSGPIDLYTSKKDIMYTEHQNGDQSVSKFQFITLPNVDSRIPSKAFKIEYVLNGTQWHRWVLDKLGRVVHYSRFDGYWYKQKYNDDGSVSSFQNSNGVVR